MQNVTSSVIFSNQRSIYQAFNVIGGSSVVLRILETSLEITSSKLRDSIVYTVLSLLLTLLSNNWRLEKNLKVSTDTVYCRFFNQIQRFQQPIEI